MELDRERGRWESDLSAAVRVGIVEAPNAGTIRFNTATARSIDYSSDLQRLPSGKIQRRLVREHYRQGCRG